MFKEVKVGDTVHRLLAGTVPMDLRVAEVDDRLIHCHGGWTFERATGAEEDHDLHWGSQYGITGSFLVHTYTPEQQAKLDEYRRTHEKPDQHNDPAEGQRDPGGDR